MMPGSEATAVQTRPSVTSRRAEEVSDYWRMDEPDLEGGGSQLDVAVWEEVTLTAVLGRKKTLHLPLMVTEVFDMKWNYGFAKNSSFPRSF